MRKRKGRLKKEVISVRSMLISILSGGIFLLGTFSCATLPKGPLVPGEVRLLSIDVPGAGIKANLSFTVNVFFDSVGEPAITKVCFYESEEDQHCFDPSYFVLGTKRALQVHMPGFNTGSHRVECYAQYIRDGQTRKTNVIATQILIGL